MRLEKGVFAFFVFGEHILDIRVFWVYATIHFEVFYDSFTTILQKD